MPHERQWQIAHDTYISKDIPHLKLPFEIIWVCGVWQGILNDYQNLKSNNFTDFKNPDSFFPQRHNPKYDLLFQCKHQSVETTFELE